MDEPLTPADRTALSGLFTPGIEYPSNLEYRCLLLKRATGGLDVYVRAMDEDGTNYMACADDCDGQGGWFTVATAYAHSSVAALDALIAKLGYRQDDEGNIRRAPVAAQREAA